MNANPQPDRSISITINNLYIPISNMLPSAKFIHWTCQVSPSLPTRWKEAIYVLPQS